jgi:hypothetical protein
METYKVSDLVGPLPDTSLCPIHGAVAFHGVCHRCRAEAAMEDDAKAYADLFPERDHLAMAERRQRSRGVLAQVMARCEERHKPFWTDFWTKAAVIALFVGSLAFALWAIYGRH